MPTMNKTYYYVIHRHATFGVLLKRQSLPWENCCVQENVFKEGSVYFTADFLAATDRLELLCRQSDTIRMRRSVCHAISVLLKV